MASADEVNSTLKNLVSNVGLLANSTAVANALTIIDTSLNAIATALATVHTFGGNITFATGAITAVINNPHIASNAAITFSPGNEAAGNLVTNVVDIEGVTTGQAVLVSQNTAALGTELFYYVGYNP